jgi:hypothetical protein
LFLREGGSATDFSYVSDIGSALYVQKTAASALALIYVDPKPSDGTSLSQVSFFRNTTTTGGVDAVFYRGDGSSTVVHQIESDTGDAEFCKGGGSLSEGGNDVLTEGAAEISAIAEKTSTVPADVVVIEDSADSWAKKRVALSNLVDDCPEYKYIKATGQSEGDVHLSDGTNWNTSLALIKRIKIETAATDWDGWIVQNDNGYSTDDANIPAIQFMSGGNGDLEVDLDHPYEDEDASDEVHLYLMDNVGSNTFDVYVLGYGMK